MKRLIDDTVGEGEWYYTRSKEGILDFAVAWEWSDVTLPVSYVTGRDKPNYPMPAIYVPDFFLVACDEMRARLGLPSWE